jgi:hypothetical protein
MKHATFSPDMTNKGTSRLDVWYARATGAPRLFDAGWGDEDLIERMGSLADAAPPAEIDLRWDEERVVGDTRVLKGRFESPLAAELPPESRTAYVELHLPRRWIGTPSACLHLATLGDEGFGRRRRSMVRPLVARGIAGMMLESPFHGRRRPASRRGVELRQVSELAVMARATVEEARALVAWLHTTGYGALGVSGFGLGGLFATLAGLTLPFAVAVVPCLAPSALAPALLDGIHGESCNWRVLNEEHFDPARPHLGELLAGFDPSLLPAPRQPGAVVQMAATDDAYVPAGSAVELERLWAGSELRWLDGGHIAAILSHRSAFVAAVMDAMGRLAGVEARGWQDNSEPSGSGGGAKRRRPRPEGWASRSEDTHRQKLKPWYSTRAAALK